MKHLGDIKKINGADVPPVNVIIGGSPCQDLSVAGRREGLKGERSGLFMEQIRIIKEMRSESERNGATDVQPRYMVWENVPGAFSSNKGQDFKAVLEETIGVVEKENKPDIPIPDGGWHYSGCIVGDGFSVAWRVFDAQFWGVPQRRRRIALVADFGGTTAPEILFERKGVFGDSPPSGTPWKDFATAVKERFGKADRERTERINTAYCLQGNGIDRADTAGCNGRGWREDKSYTLNTIDRPAVYDARGNGDGETAPTITGDHENRVTDYTSLVCTRGGLRVAGFKYGAGAESDIAYREEQSPTLLAGQNDAATVIATVENGGGRRSHRCIGLDLHTCSITGDKTMTMTASKADAQHVPSAICVRERCGCEGGGKGCLIQNERSGTLAVNNDQFVCSLDRASFNQGVNAQYDPKISEDGINSTLTAKGPGAVCESVVRRLTPLECERLQGFPDGWTDIGEYIDTNGKKRKTSDSARYKALGNSIALPSWMWVLERISNYCGTDKTMASLFDGIGGFPLIWETLNGQGTCLWASEIEEFPIAVTKYHFNKGE